MLVNLQNKSVAANSRLWYSRLKKQVQGLRIFIYQAYEWVASKRLTSLFDDLIKVERCFKFLVLIKSIKRLQELIKMLKIDAMNKQITRDGGKELAPIRIVDD